MGDARTAVVVIVRGGGVKHDELAADAPIVPTNRFDGHSAHYMSSIVYRAQASEGGFRRNKRQLRILHNNEGASTHGRS